MHHHYGIYVKAALLLGVLWAGYRRPQSLSWYLAAMVANLLCFEPFITLTVTLGAAVNLWRFHRRWHWPYNTGPLAGLFAVAVVCTIPALTAGASPRPLLVWCGIGLYYLVLTQGLARTGLLPVRSGLVVGALATCTAALIEYARGDTVCTGAYWQQNMFAMSINALFPVLMVWGLDRDSTDRQSAMHIMVGAALSSAILLTLSRTGLALNFAALTALSLRSLGGDVLPSRRHWLLLAMVVIGCAWVVRWNAIDWRFTDAPLSNLDARVVYSDIALRLAAEHPGGLGLDQFEGTLAQLPGRERGYYPVAPIHNIFIQVRTELGLIGLAVLLLVLWRFLLLTWRGMRLSGHALMFSGLLLGQVVFVTNHLMEPHMLSPPNALIGLFFAAVAQTITRA